MKDNEIELNAIHDAVGSQDAAALDAAVDSIATFTFESLDADALPFPDQLFDGILNELRRKEFLEMKGGFALAMLFEYEWARLSSRQREKLLTTLRDTYHALIDWMTCFVYVELLGRFYHDDVAYKVLCSFKAASNEKARSLVATGFEKLWTACETSELRACALQSLTDLLNDQSALVKREAREALKRIEVKAPPPGLDEYR